MSGFVATIGYVALVLLVFGIVSTIHEFGHYFAARAFGLVPPVFSIGVGPSWLTLKHHRWGTTWQLAPFIVLSFVGLPSRTDNEIEKFFETRIGKSLLIALFPVFCVISLLMCFVNDEENPAHTIDDLKPWQRFVIAAAGPAANILVAVLTLSSLYFWFGEDALACTSGGRIVVAPDLRSHLWNSEVNIIGALANATIITFAILLMYFQRALLVFIMLFSGEIMLHGNIESVEHVANSVKQASESNDGVGFFQLVVMFFLINLAIAVLNLFPVPALDGSTLMVESTRWLFPESIHYPFRITVQLSGMMVISALLFWTIGRDVYFYGLRMIHCLSS